MANIKSYSAGINLHPFLIGSDDPADIHEYLVEDYGLIPLPEYSNDRDPGLPITNHHGESHFVRGIENTSYIFPLTKGIEYTFINGTWFYRRIDKDSYRYLRNKAIHAYSTFTKREWDALLFLEHFHPECLTSDTKDQIAVYRHEERLTEIGRNARNRVRQILSDHE